MTTEHHHETSNNEAEQVLRAYLAALTAGDVTAIAEASRRTRGGPCTERSRSPGPRTAARRS